MGKKKILVIEDDPEMRLALQVRLRANNYHVDFAVDGVSGVAEARKHTPDIILLDLGLPAGDGFVVLERLHALPALAGIPVIVVSGRDRAASYERAHALGASSFLQKPVKNSELLLVISRLLDIEQSPKGMIYEIGSSSQAGV